jgi:colicin import membrane protein
MKEERLVVEELALKIRRSGCPGTQERVLLDLVDDLQAARTCKDDNVAKTRRKVEILAWRMLENASEASDSRTERLEKLMSTQRDEHERERQRAEAAVRAKTKVVAAKHRDQLAQRNAKIKELQAANQALLDAAEKSNETCKNQVSEQVARRVQQERQQHLIQFDRQVIAARERVENEFKLSLDEAAAKEKSLQFQLEELAQEKRALQAQSVAMHEELDKAREATHQTRCAHDDTARRARGLELKLSQVEATSAQALKDAAVEARATSIAAQHRETQLLAKHEEELQRVRTRVKGILARKDNKIEELQSHLVSALERAEHAEEVLLRVETKFVASAMKSNHG